ncbi:hypothetical protein [Microvirga tunisiensis]|uniref:Uncharacterized protein n=1 Tax=Microvirga tunisiensis TaxID=2108360 RepID=A0A5N7ML13_9HYPH|nr:hypothetical protein [Microvirga tunisiensis]MPR09531.1 hypothetical protein [Microvirga tunisiensis]MPR27751.1 hypothetical protein [Microvirga tunisiensis]
MYARSPDPRIALLFQWMRVGLLISIVFAVGMAIPRRASAFTPCADPASYLVICCPKPCPIGDNQSLVQHTFQQAIEELKNNSMFKELLAWKDQLQSLGQDLGLINSLITQLMGGPRAGGLSGFGIANGLPQAIHGNPLSAVDMAAQFSIFFGKPATGIIEGQRETARRQEAISSGYIEGLAAALGARSKLAQSPEEIKKLQKVVSSTRSTHDDLAAMNTVRVAMLQALQNRSELLSRLTATDSYNQLGTLGPDDKANRSSWGITTAEAPRLPMTQLADSSPGSLALAAAATAAVSETAPKTPYVSPQLDLDRAISRSGFGQRDESRKARSASVAALTAFDNLVERSIQLHNAGVSVKSMRETQRLNQETVDEYNRILNASNEFRAALAHRLILFYVDPAQAFKAMAAEAIGSNGLGGLDPYEWGDSYLQNAASITAGNTIVQNASLTPGRYGITVCFDEQVSFGGGGDNGPAEQRLVANFSKVPQPIPVDLLGIVENPNKLTCGALLSMALSQWVPETDVNAVIEFMQYNVRAFSTPAFTFWINLEKKAIWLYEFALNAQDVINHTEHELRKLASLLADPEKTPVLNSLPGLKNQQVNIMNFTALSAIVTDLNRFAGQYRAKIEPKYLAEPDTEARVKKLDKAVAAIQTDVAYDQWVSTNPPPKDDPTCGIDCLGAQPPTEPEPQQVVITSPYPCNANLYDCRSLANPGIDYPVRPQRAFRAFIPVDAPFSRS